jgi:hypothetical protein
MTLRVAFLHAARRDFEDAAVWYEERRSGLSAEFRAEVDAAVALAAERPSGRLDLYAGCTAAYLQLHSLSPSSA